MISLEKTYETAISIRNLEVDQFWKRNVFLFGIEGLILSFFIGSFEYLISSNYNLILIISSIFGLILSILVGIIVRSNKKWVEHWENKVKKIEDENNFQVKLFDSHSIEGTSTKSCILGICMLFFGFWVIILVYVISIVMLQ